MIADAKQHQSLSVAGVGHQVFGEAMITSGIVGMLIMGIGALRRGRG